MVQARRKIYRLVHFALDIVVCIPYINSIGNDPCLIGDETMTTWTHENTDGFTDTQLEMINRVAERVRQIADGIEAGSISDAINNSWIEGITEDDLFAEACRLLNVIEAA